MRLRAPLLCVSRSAVASVIGILLSQATVHAQSVVNPTVLEFRASTDHAATVNGTPIVSRYDMGFYLVGAAQPFQVNPLGKPTPSNGVIQLPLSSVGSLPSPGITYEARITAVGPGGNGTSQPSNTFAFAAACTFGVSPTAPPSVVSGGGTGSVSVTTTAGCPWTATSNAGWITITSGASGSANGSVGYSVAANTGSSARSGTLTVAGQTVTVNQSGACTFTVTPTSVDAQRTASTGTFSVAAGAGCSWTAVSNASWISVTSGASGSGNGSVGYSVAASGTVSARTGTLTIAGRTVSITQPSVPAPTAPTGLRILQ